MDQQIVTVAREAMATRFEIAIYGDNPVSLRAAAEEALEEVQRVEGMLSWRKPTSPIAQINAMAGREPVRVNQELFDLLIACKGFWEQTNRAFDITVGPLMKAYGFHRQDQCPNDETEIMAAKEACGMENLLLDESARTVAFAHPGMRLDFGAIGKGYAVDLAVEILREIGVESALVHGGTSTVFGIGRPPEMASWKIAVEYPPGDDPDESLPVLSVLELKDCSMSVSAVWGRLFRVGQDSFGHVIDPRTGSPAQRALLSIWKSKSATEADALSTALLTEGSDGVASLSRRYDGAGCLVLGTGEQPGTFDIRAHDLDWRPRVNSTKEN